MARPHSWSRPRRGIWTRADRGRRVRRIGHVDGDDLEQIALGVEHLDATVAPVGDIDAVLRVHGDGVQGVELSRFLAVTAPGLQPAAVRGDLGHARVDVAVADVGVAVAVPGHVGNLAELAVHRRQGRLGMGQGMGALVGGLGLAAEHHGHLPAGVNLMTMSEPLSATQMFCCGSMRTAWAKDQA